MTDKQLRALVVERLTEVEGYDDSGHRNHVLGVVRGLLWALTGQDPGGAALRKTSRMLDLAGVPYTWDGDTVLIGDEWLLEHGLEPGSI